MLLFLLVHTSKNCCEISQNAVNKEAAAFRRVVGEDSTRQGGFFPPDRPQNRVLASRAVVLQIQNSFEEYIVRAVLPL